jgi:hypothetical protein
MQHLGEPIIIALPTLFKGMAKGKIKLWYVEEDPPTLIGPSQQLLSVETASRIYSIPMPPTITGYYRVRQILKHAGEEVTVGENLIILEPVEGI